MTGQKKVSKGRPKDPMRAVSYYVKEARQAWLSSLAGLDPDAQMSELRAALREIECANKSIHAELVKVTLETFDAEALRLDIPLDFSLSADTDPLERPGEFR